MSKQLIKRESENTPETEVISGISGGTGNVAQIRDILFGGQMREYERRFARLEARLEQEMVSLKEDVRKQLEYLDSYVKKEFSSLSDQLISEQQKRERAVDSLGEQLNKAGGDLKEKLSQHEVETNKNFREIRHTILEQTKAMTEEVDRKISATHSAMTQAEKELRAEKMDRTTLSNLFNEIAIRISDEDGFAGLLTSGETEHG
jgi:hypothetical protein